MRVRERGGGGGAGDVQSLVGHVAVRLLVRSNLGSSVPAVEMRLIAPHVPPGVRKYWTELSQNLVHDRQQLRLCHVCRARGGGVPRVLVETTGEQLRQANS